MKLKIVLIVVAIATFVLMACGSVAKSSPSQKSVAQHDRDVLRFFMRHPKLAASPAGMTALLRIIAHQQTQLRSLQSARTIAYTNDWVTAVKNVQKLYPGSQQWLLNCSASEGGHGVFVYHGGGTTYPGYDTPGGWMQYFESTFWTDYDAAVRDLTSRGYKVPLSTGSWHSPVGQALAAGWAYGHARPSGKWTGYLC